jgi:hypothetical protein
MKYSEANVPDLFSKNDFSDAILITGALDVYGLHPGTESCVSPGLEIVAEYRSCFVGGFTGLSDHQQTAGHE